VSTIRIITHTTPPLHFGGQFLRKYIYDVTGSKTLIETPDEEETTLET
jgi:hypothetical protein